MRELVVQVVQTRERAGNLWSQYNALLTEWEAANGELIAAMKAAKVAQQQAENRLRAAAVDNYNTTGDKNPAPGVAVKMGTQLIYDTEAAFAWAMEHEMCLLLDTKGFEKIAKATLNFIPCVQRAEVPFATLAADLHWKDDDR